MSLSPLPRRLARTAARLPVVGGALALALAATMLPATPAQALSYRIDKRFFGVHDTNPSSASWPALSAGSLRLWDAGVRWADIETAPGVFDFARLDDIVRAAKLHNVELTLVLGQTPSFYGASTSAMPDMTAWTSYVRAVVTRYSPAVWGYRGIAAYQVWNEANVTSYWTGTPIQMAQLTRAAYGTVKTVDPGALVIGPAFAARIAEQTRGIGFFYYIRLDGVPIWRSLDAIALNLYPLARYPDGSLGTPEKSMSILASTRYQMQLRGVPASKPIWNTEINYGLATGGSGASNAMTADRQAAYVLRTYLLNAANGIRRVDWYAWDRPDLGNTKLSSPGATSDALSKTLAGKAFELAQAWLVGGKLAGARATAKPCAKDRAGTYTCVITYPGGVRRVYWNPTRTVAVTTAKTATFMVGVYGKRTAIKGGSRKTVDFHPLMVRSKS